MAKSLATKSSDELRVDARVEALDPCALELLGVLTLENRELPRKRLYDQAIARGVRSPKEGPLTPSRMRMIIDDLARQHLLMAESNHRVAPMDFVSLDVLACLHARGRLQALTRL